MARDGSTGTYTRAVPPYVFDTIIDEAAVNSEFDDIAAALTQSVSKDGQTTMTGNLKMGGYKLTNAGDASAQNEYTTAAQVQKGTASYLLSIGGTADAITAIAPFSMAAYTEGQQFIFVPTANNTSTTPTININAIGALTIKRDASAALVADDIVSGRPAKLYYDGTDMILLNPATVAASQLQVSYLPTAGGTMTGPIAMGNNKVTDLADGTNSDDAVNKGQLDAVASSVPAAASDSEVRAETAGNIFVRPDRVRLSPATAGAWVSFDGRGTIDIYGSYNTSGITDNGAGNYTQNFTTVFTGGGIAPAIAGRWSGGAGLDLLTIGSISASSVNLINSAVGGSNRDAPTIASVVCGNK